LEKEYAARLQGLAKKAGEKKSKRMSRLVLGDEPTQMWTEETVKIRYAVPEDVIYCTVDNVPGIPSTFDKAYSKLLSSLENGAQDHMILADSLASQVVDELKKLERRSEETKKKVSMSFEFPRKPSLYT
jgi:hypothetical protein